MRHRLGLAGVLPWIAVAALCTACGPSSAPAPVRARAAVSEERLAMGSLLRLTA